VEDVIIVITL